MQTLTSFGMLGASTNFGEAFAHLYLDSVAMNYNRSGVAETFGNGTAETLQWTLS